MKSCSWPYCGEVAIDTVQVKFSSKPFDLSLCSSHLALHRHAESCWNSLISTQGFLQTHLLFGLSVDLLRDAFLSYEAGNINSSTLMCRSALEASLHSRISVKNPKYNKNPDGSFYLHTFDHDYECDRLVLSDIIDIAKNLNYLSGMEDKVNKVKELGDFVAHNGERVWKEIMKATDNPRSDSIHMWLTAPEAKNAIDFTVQILQKLISDFYSSTIPS